MTKPPTVGVLCASGPAQRSGATPFAQLEKKSLRWRQVSAPGGVSGTAGVRVGAGAKRERGSAHAVDLWAGGARSKVSFACMRVCTPKQTHGGEDSRQVEQVRAVTCGMTRRRYRCECLAWS
jgi:hypothetical protein